LSLAVATSACNRIYIALDSKKCYDKDNQYKAISQYASVKGYDADD